MDSFQGQVEKVLGEQTKVKAQKQEIVIECEILDEVTSWEDISVALREQNNLSGIRERMEKVYRLVVIIDKVKIG